MRRAVCTSSQCGTSAQRARSDTLVYRVSSTSRRDCALRLHSRLRHTSSAPYHHARMQSRREYATLNQPFHERANAARASCFVVLVAVACRWHRPAHATPLLVATQLCTTTMHLMTSLVANDARPRSRTPMRTWHGAVDLQLCSRQQNVCALHRRSHHGEHVHVHRCRPSAHTHTSLPPARTHTPHRACQLHAVVDQHALTRLTARASSTLLWIRCVGCARILICSTWTFVRSHATSPVTRTARQHGERHVLRV